MMYRGLLLSLLSAAVIFKVDNSSWFYSFFRQDLFVLEELDLIILSHQLQPPLYCAVSAVLLYLYTIPYQRPYVHSNSSPGANAVPHSYLKDLRFKDSFSSCILNSGTNHEANSQAIIGWAKVPPDFPCFEMIPVAFVWSIHNLGVRVKDAAFFLSSSSL